MIKSREIKEDTLFVFGTGESWVRTIRASVAGICLRVWLLTTILETTTSSSSKPRNEVSAFVISPVVVVIRRLLRLPVVFGLTISISIILSIVVLLLLLVDLILECFDSTFVPPNDFHPGDGFGWELRRTSEIFQVLSALNGDNGRILLEIFQAILHVRNDLTGSFE